MSFIKKIECDLTKIINEIGYEIDNVFLSVSNRPDLGEYQLNDAMKLAKKYSTNPRQIAERIVEVLNNDNRFINVNIAGSGFINISISDDYLIECMNQMIKDVYNNIDLQAKKKIILDYGGANVAKALHVGHLRSANIGEALKRLARTLGVETLADAHLGDWGRPIGLVMLEIKNRNPLLPYFDETFDGEYPEESPVTNDDLMELYPFASAKAKEDPVYMEEARVITAKFQNRDKGLMALWNHIMKVSKADIKRIYDKLNTTFEIWNGESDEDKFIPEMINYLETKNLIEESQGARIINVKEESDDREMPPLLLIKSNGGASYETTDLACIWGRVKLHSPDEIWYLTDVRQSLHFEQVFRAAKKAKIVDENVKLEFIPFGTMNGSDGKPFKTRDGGVMKLEDLLTLAENECEKKILPNIIGQERKEIAEKVSVAAVKYADLIPFRGTDYIFDIAKFSDLEGKTGPYLLYSTIRMKSLLNKAESLNLNFDEVKIVDNECDREIMLNVLNLPLSLTKSYENRSLNEIADYIYKLTSSYNKFYSENRVLDEQNEETRSSWLALTKLVLNINLMLLDILGIECPSKM
ncbi:MAG: arginine--tRNA ligase [Bacilli bacterium]|nr:arginine--tRNA ligase [Bacilli bacterium]